MRFLLPSKRIRQTATGADQQKSARKWAQALVTVMAVVKAMVKLAQDVGKAVVELPAEQNNGIHSTAAPASFLLAGAAYYYLALVVHFTHSC